MFGDFLVVGGVLCADVAQLLNGGTFISVTWSQSWAPSFLCLLVAFSVGRLLREIADLWARAQLDVRSRPLRTISVDDTRSPIEDRRSPTEDSNSPPEELLIRPELT